MRLTHEELQYVHDRDNEWFVTMLAIADLLRYYADNEKVSDNKMYAARAITTVRRRYEGAPGVCENCNGL